MMAVTMRDSVHHTEHPLLIPPVVDYCGMTAGGLTEAFVPHWRDKPSRPCPATMLRTCRKREIIRRVVPEPNEFATVIPVASEKKRVTKWLRLMTGNMIVNGGRRGPSVVVLKPMKRVPAPFGSLKLLRAARS